MLKSLSQLDLIKTAIDDLIDGTNCSVLLKKGLGSVIASMCSFDNNNPSMLSSLLEISFFQLLIT